MAKSSRRTNPLLAAKSKVCSTSQVGGIETSVLDNGPGRGTRVAWVNTGSDLRYKVLIDRGLDIADAFFGSHSLSWHSFGGVTAPTTGLNKGLDWLRSFYGGLVVSCGPTHLGPPTVRNGEEIGLHGRHSNTPATVESICNPDLSIGQTAMSITGTVRTAKVFGPNVELRRTITSELGQPAINITDTFRNMGNETVPHAWLLHINFGYPLLDAGSELLWSGQITPIAGSEHYFTKSNKFKIVPEPLPTHKGASECCTFIQPKTNRSKMASLGVYNPNLGLAVEIRCDMTQFQRFLNWQHWGPRGEYVTALEPNNCPQWGVPNISRKKDPSHRLRPGQARTYQTSIVVHTRPSDITAFRRRVAGKK